MSNDRGLLGALVTELTGGVMQPHFRVELELPSGTVRLWNGRGDLTADDAVGTPQTWNGDARLLGIDRIEETIKTRATFTTIFLSGTDNGLRTAFIGDNWHGSAGRVWVALMDRSNPGTELGVLMQFYGLMDFVEFDEAADQPIIRCTIAWAFSDARERAVRLTDHDQQRRFTGDLGLQYVTSVQETKVKVARI